MWTPFFSTTSPSAFFPWIPTLGKRTRCCSFSVAFRSEKHVCCCHINLVHARCDISICHVTWDHHSKNQDCHKNHWRVHVSDWWWLSTMINECIFLKQILLVNSETYFEWDAVVDVSPADTRLFYTYTTQRHKSASSLMTWTDKFVVFGWPIKVNISTMIIISIFHLVTDHSYE
jgi:hypothetical protein